MTACNNNVRGGKASRVITAALVATLSVGTPMAAIASTVSEGGIDMLATTEETIKQGTVAYSEGKPGDTFEANGKEQGIVPSTLTLAGPDGETEDVTFLADRQNSENGYFYYYVEVGATGGQSFNGSVTYVDKYGDEQNLTGNKVMDADNNYVLPSAPGTYAVVVGYFNGAWTYVAKADTFTITSQSFKGAVLFDNSDGEKDVTDTTYNWDGQGDPTSIAASDVAHELGISLDGKVLNSGTANASYNDADYEINFYLQGASSKTNTLEVGKSYIAKVSGKAGSEYQNYEPTEFEFTLNKCDLSTAKIETATIYAPSSAPTNISALDTLVSKINGESASTFTMKSAGGTDYAVLSFVSDPDGNMTSSSKKGEYTYTLSAAKDSAYFTGSQTFKVLYADSRADIKYDVDNDDTLDTLDGTTINVDLTSKDPAYFDSSAVEVTYNSDSKKLKDGITFEYFDEDNNKVDASALKIPGTYTVKVTVNADVKGTIVAGSATATVKVVNGTVTKNADVFVSYDGKNVDGLSTKEVTYSGEDLSKNISVLVKNSNKTYTEGTDYTVELSKKVDGKYVETDDMVDAGEYQLKVTPVTFVNASGTKDPVTFDFKVKALTIADADVVYTIDYKDPAKSDFLPYTGEVITPSYKFYDSTSTDKKEIALDPSDFTVTYTKNSQKADLKEKGTYTATIKLNKDVVNYELAGGSLTVSNILVDDASIYGDVPSNTWYASAIQKAKDLNYMSGYAGTNLFGPTAKLTRAQAVVVLYNMAGGEYSGTDIAPDDSYNKNDVYTTGFADVDADGSNAWATYAIKWAKDTGLTVGYGDGNFGPNDEISRAQFATMLARYAQLVGKYEAVADADDVISGYSDAASVDPWFKDSVAWAVSEGVMGQNVTELTPNASIERAQVAAMAVRFQPEALR